MNGAKTLSECHKSVGYGALTERGRDIYNRLCKRMLESGDIPFLYLDQLTMYAHSYADFLELDEAVKRDGHTLVSRDKRGDNRVYPNPAVKMRRDALADLIRIAKNFGFSKLDKVRLRGSPDDNGGDLFDEFMKAVGSDDDD